MILMIGGCVPLVWRNSARKDGILFSVITERAPDFMYGVMGYFDQHSQDAVQLLCP